MSWSLFGSLLGATFGGNVLTKLVVNLFKARTKQKERDIEHQRAHTKELLEGYSELIATIDHFLVLGEEAAETIRSVQTETDRINALREQHSQLEDDDPRKPEVRTRLERQVKTVDELEEELTAIGPKEDALMTAVRVSLAKTELMDTDLDRREALIALRDALPGTGMSAKDMDAYLANVKTKRDAVMGLARGEFAPKARNP